MPRIPKIIERMHAPQPVRTGWKKRFNRLLKSLVTWSAFGLISPSQLRGQSAIMQVNPQTILDRGRVISTWTERDKPPLSIQIDPFEESKKQAVRSPVNGTILSVGGNLGTVAILDEHGNRHELLHLDVNAYRVKKGDTVRPGDVLGYLSNTGTDKARVQYMAKGRKNQYLYLIPCPEDQSISCLDVDEKPCLEIESFNSRLLVISPEQIGPDPADLDRRIEELLSSACDTGKPMNSHSSEICSLGSCEAFGCPSYYS